MVKGKTYRVQETGKYLTPDEVVFEREDAVEKDTGEPVIATWEKMSKSKFNGVEPEEIFDKYGIDASRLLILANVPPRGDRNWSDETIPGVTNWQNRIWTVLTSFRKVRMISFFLFFLLCFDKIRAKTATTPLPHLLYIKYKIFYVNL